MDGNNTTKTVLGAIGVALLVLVITIAAIYFTILLGYIIGLLIAATPFISDWLTESLPITKDQISGIVAWMSVASLFIGGTNVASRKKND